MSQVIILFLNTLLTLANAFVKDGSNASAIIQALEKLLPLITEWAVQEAQIVKDIIARLKDGKKRLTDAEWDAVVALDRQYDDLLAQAEADFDARVADAQKGTGA